ncbi:acyltransferase [Desulfogranum mediterraneum]|uniref:acyltransferase n=1 Tax=Desulfogranum mediterraneum TaxID=160661 RepID=UPI0004225390|nr:acyltransferase [Desulfogranum mediterraneum]
MIQGFLLNIRLRKRWYHKLIYKTVFAFRALRLPFPGLFGAVFFNLHNVMLMCWRRLKQFFFYEPMLRYRCSRVGRSVFFEVNFPLIIGYGSLSVGDKVTIGGNVTVIVSYKINPDPVVSVGDNVYLGYATVLSCAERIAIGDNVLIAERCSIFDNNNHPVDPVARKNNEPIGRADVAPVVVEDGAWIGARSIIMKGVTVGRDSVVAAGSVVTRDVPPGMIVAGNPAVVVKQIKSASG